MAIKDHKNATHNIYKLNDCELMTITGGFSISGTLLSAFSRAIKILFEIGQSLGTSLNMIKNNKTCK